MKVVALHNLKGGVGKTTAAVHLAHVAALAGRPTLLWDLDAQGAASWVFRVRVGDDTRPRRLLRDRSELWSAIRGSDWADLDVLPADLSLRKLESALERADAPERAFAEALAALGERYERIVLDCAPGISRLSRCVFESVDALVVPTIPTTLSLRTLAALHEHLRGPRRHGLLVLPFFSMVDARRAMHRRVREFARAERLGFLATEIPYSAHIESFAARRAPMTAGRRVPAAAAFVALAREVEERMEELGPAPKLRRARLMELVRGNEGREPGAASAPESAPRRDA